MPEQPLVHRVTVKTIKPGNAIWADGEYEVLSVNLWTYPDEPKECLAHLETVPMLEEFLALPLDGFLWVIDGA